MIVRRFLLWARTASASERASAVRLLAQAYVRGQVPEVERPDAETALLAILHDPAPLVRRALAEVVASDHVPRALVLGLAQDQPDIAALVLAASPVLADADLIDAVAMGDALAQEAVARRFEMGPGVAAALIALGAPEAVALLLDNPFAPVSAADLEQAAQRFGDDATVRGALLARADLPMSLRHALTCSVARSLASWADQAGWLGRERAERLVRETTERVAVRMGAESLARIAGEAELMELIDSLRASGRLTPSLILRSLLSGEPALAEAALASLANMPLARARAILQDRRGAGVAPLCRKAGIPALLVPAFVAASTAAREVSAAGPAEGQGLSRRIIEHVLIACDNGRHDDHAGLIALLRRFEAEAAREEARILADGMADHAALAALLEVDPDLTLIAQQDRSFADAA